MFDYLIDVEFTINIITSTKFFTCTTKCSSILSAVDRVQCFCHIEIHTLKLFWNISSLSKKEKKKSIIKKMVKTIDCFTALKLDSWY